MASLDLHTDGSILAMADRLHEDKPRMNRDQFAKLEQVFGLNYSPSSILFSTNMRSIVRPCTNYIRDWQHTLASSGVAGSQIAGCLAVLKKDAELRRRGIGLEAVQQYCATCNMPRESGEINENWFHSRYLDKDHVKHFASDVPCMIPMLTAFLHQVVKPLGLCVSTSNA